MSLVKYLSHTFWCHALFRNCGLGEDASGRCALQDVHDH